MDDKCKLVFKVDAHFSVEHFIFILMFIIIHRQYATAVCCHTLLTALKQMSPFVQRSGHFQTFQQIIKFSIIM